MSELDASSMRLFPPLEKLIVDRFSDKGSGNAQRLDKDSSIIECGFSSSGIAETSHICGAVREYAETVRSVCRLVTSDDGMHPIRKTVCKDVRDALRYCCSTFMLSSKLLKDMKVIVGLVTPPPLTGGDGSDCRSDSTVTGLSSQTSCAVSQTCASLFESLVPLGAECDFRKCDKHERKQWCSGDSIDSGQIVSKANDNYSLVMSFLQHQLPNIDFAAFSEPDRELQTVNLVKTTIDLLLGSHKNHCFGSEIFDNDINFVDSETKETALSIVCFEYNQYPELINHLIEKHGADPLTASLNINPETGSQVIEFVFKDFPLCRFLSKKIDPFISFPVTAQTPKSGVRQEILRALTNLLSGPPSARESTRVTAARKNTADCVFHAAFLISLRCPSFYALHLLECGFTCSHGPTEMHGGRIQKLMSSLASLVRNSSGFAPRASATVPQPRGVISALSILKLLFAHGVLDPSCAQACLKQVIHEEIVGRLREMSEPLPTCIESSAQWKLMEAKLQPLLEVIADNVGPSERD